VEHRVAHKRIARATLAIAALLALGCHRETAVVVARPTAPSPLEAENRRLRQQVHEQQEDVAAQRAYIDEVTKTINDVQDHLTRIAPVETTVRLTRDAVEGGETLSPSRRRDMLARLEWVQAQLAADASQLSALQRQTAPLRVRINSLEAMLKRLQGTLENRNRDVTALRLSLSKMSAKVVMLEHVHHQDDEKMAAMHAELETRSKELSDAIDQANLAYYAVGPVKELAARGLLREKRHFLRRSTFEIAEKLHPQDFRRFASARDREIVIPALPPQLHLYPPRPTNSYHIQPTPPASSKLVIDDPKSFWAMRFVVIAVE
jgi:predicted  nucleic acid-binding Zn-ribbon protein